MSEYSSARLKVWRHRHIIIQSLLLVAALCSTVAGSTWSSAQTPGKRAFQEQKDLIEALAAAKTDDERARLLESNRPLVTPQLSALCFPLAALAEVRGRYDLMARYMRAARQVAAFLGDRKGELFALRALGLIHHSQHEYTQALTFFNEGLHIAEELNDKRETAVILNRIADANRALGDHDQLLASAERALILAEEVGDGAELALARYETGVAYYLLGNYILALRHLQASRDYFEEVGDKARLITTLNAVGNVYGLQGDYDQAHEFYQQSLKLSEAVNHKGVNALNNVGVVQYLRGDYAAALDKFRLSLKLAEEVRDRPAAALCLNNIGITNLAQGDMVQALDHSRRSLAIAEQIDDRERISEALNNIARALHQSGNHKEALGAAERAIAVAKQTRIQERLWEAHTTAGKSYAALKQYDLARRAFMSAIETMEGAREQVAGGERAKQLFLEGKVAPYHAMLELLLAEGKSSEALGYAERAKGRVLLDVLKHGKAEITKVMAGVEREQERKLEGEIRKLNSQVLVEEAKPSPDRRVVVNLEDRLRKARLDYEAFQTSLYAKHPELKTWRGQFSPQTSQQLATLISDKSVAALEYVVTEQNSYLFVLTSRRGTNPNEKGSETDLRVYPLGVSGKDLAVKVRGFRTQVAERRIDFATLGRELYDLLIRPAQRQLAGVRTLCIVPDGVLWELPFQALQNGSQFIIEEKAVFYAPSISVLGEVTGRSAPSKKPNGATRDLLAFANPSLGSLAAERAALTQRGKKLVPLPEAETEARELARHYGVHRSTVYMGREAREERAKAELSDYRVIHFATHGFLDDANPMYSYLVLAQGAGGREDGLLEAREIMKMNLQADLAVLSACDTALGRVSAGEGMIGITWALFVAGCPATLASQWAVESASTSSLMVEFHRQWLKPDPDSAGMPAKAAALRKAELKLLSSKDFSHPYYWAGFALVGDAR